MGHGEQTFHLSRTPRLRCVGWLGELLDLVGEEVICRACRYTQRDLDLSECLRCYLLAAFDGHDGAQAELCVFGERTLGGVPGSVPNSR